MTPMSKPHAPATAGFSGTARKVVVCLLVAGLSVVAVQGISQIMESRLPLLDFSERALVSKSPSSLPGGDDRLRFAVATMVTAEETFSTYRRFVERICRDIGRKMAFVLRPSYTDVRRGLEQGQVDVAFVCTGTYIHAFSGGQVKLLVQPQFEEGLSYRSIIIVPFRSAVKELEDLRGKIMAFTDHESHTGCLVPSAVVANRGYNPRTFFEKVVFTGSHDRSIQAVALGMVDCAAVDSLVWESKVKQDSSLARRVRIVWESEEYGPPPIVVPAGLAEKLENDLRTAFLTLHEDEEGRGILRDIGIKRFVPARHEDYETAIELYRRFESRGYFQWP